MIERGGRYDGSSARRSWCWRLQADQDTLFASSRLTPASPACLPSPSQLCFCFVKMRYASSFATAMQRNLTQRGKSLFVASASAAHAASPLPSCIPIRAFSTSRSALPKCVIGARAQCQCGSRKPV